jgi:hypothetical protein
VSAYEVSALAKVAAGNWDGQEVLDTKGQTGVSLAIAPAGMITIPVSFSLCKDGTINPIVGSSKGLNAMAKTTYGNGTVVNMCSDDLNTLDVVEPSGIKLSFNDLNDITNACKSLP